jgi:hypothetical protein
MSEVMEGANDGDTSGCGINPRDLNSALGWLAQRGKVRYGVRRGKPTVAVVGDRHALIREFCRAIEADLGGVIRA